LAEIQILLLLILIALVFGGQAVFYIFYFISFVIAAVLLYYAVIYGVIFVLKLASALAVMMATAVDYCIFRPSATLARAVFNIKNRSIRIFASLVFAPIICAGYYRLNFAEDKDSAIKAFPGILFVFLVVSLVWIGLVLLIGLTVTEALPHLYANNQDSQIASAQSIAEVRAKFPQYADLSDADLAGALHKKFYADMPQAEFYAKIGFKAPTVEQSGQVKPWGESAAQQAVIPNAPKENFWENSPLVEGLHQKRAPPSPALPESSPKLPRNDDPSPITEPKTLYPRMEKFHERDERAARSQAFADGLSDRTRYEQWFAGLSGPYRDGAAYWAANRSQKNAECLSTGDREWNKGCAAGRRFLTPTDARRRSEPEYKAEWNAF
jgi:hypothetical protein